jgi:hypothetical protein
MNPFQITINMLLRHVRHHLVRSRHTRRSTAGRLARLELDLIVADTGAKSLVRRLGGAG